MDARIVQQPIVVRALEKNVQTQNFELPLEDGETIKFEIVRQSFEERRRQKTCSHQNIRIDTLSSSIFCVACESKLNPIEWLATHVEMWKSVRYLYEQQQLYAKTFEGKTRTKCDHCGGITRVRPARSLTAVLRDES